MKKILPLVILTLLGALALQAKPVIKIGVILPLSGNNAYLGENARDGILLRLKELPKDSRFEYKLVFENDEQVPAKTNLAARKLKSIDKVDAIFTLWGQGYYVVIPVLKNTSIIHLSLDAWTKPSAYPYDFVLCASYEDYAKKMAEAVDAVGARSAVFLGSYSSSEVLYSDSLEKELASRKINLLDKHFTNYETRDFRTYIMKIREMNPDIVITSTVQPMIEITLRQMRELGYHPMIAAASASFMDISEKKLVEGSFYVLTPPSPVSFVERYKASYNKEPLYPAANGYDALSILVEACEKLPVDKKPTAEEISHEIRKTKNFPGILGNTNFVPPNSLSTPVVCYFIQNGRGNPVTLGELKKLKGTK